MNTPKYLFLDIETTGLNPKEDLILELGMVVVNQQLEEIDSFTAVIKTQKEVAEAMSAPIVKQMHTTSGLLDSLESGIGEGLILEQALQFIKKHFKKPALTAGNSIHFDIGFLKEVYPELVDLFYYQQLNVSSVLEAVSKIARIDIPKTEFPHRALADCRRSIALLKVCINHIKGNK